MSSIRIKTFQKQVNVINVLRTRLSLRTPLWSLAGEFKTLFLSCINPAGLFILHVWVHLLSVALHIRHLSLKLLSAIEFSQTFTALTLAHGANGLMRKLLYTRNFHKVVKHIHINQPFFNNWSPLHLFAKTQRSVFRFVHVATSKWSLPTTRLPLFIGPKFDWHHGNQGSHGTQPGTSPRSLQGGTSSCPRLHQRYVGAAGRYTAFFGCNSRASVGMPAR